MRVSDISLTKKQRYAIFIDGEFLFSAHEEVLVRSGLRVGDEVTVQELEALRAQSELLYTKEYAFRLLEYKSYTEHQLVEKLQRRTQPEVAQVVAERMVELGLVDDGAYAQRCARDLFHLKGWSPRRIAQELRCRGIADHWIEEAVGQFSEEAGTERLERLIARKYLDKLQQPNGRERVIAALARLGYGYGESRAAITKVLEEYRLETQEPSAEERVPDEEAVAGELAQLLERKYLGKLGTMDGRNKVMAALARRGYRYEDIKAALAQAALEHSIEW